MAMTGAMLAFGGLWGVPYLERAHDLPKAEAAGLVSVLFVGWGIGAPVWGIVSDRLSRRRAVIAVCGVLATDGMAAPTYLPGGSLLALSALICVQGVAG